jgi:hypothetical protein
MSLSSSSSFARLVQGSNLCGAVVRLRQIGVGWGLWIGFMWVWMAVDVEDVEWGTAHSSVGVDLKFTEIDRHRIAMPSLPSKIPNVVCFHSIE